MASLTRPAPGSMFTRSVTALLAAEGDPDRAANIASKRWPDTPTVAMHLRSAAVTADDVLAPLGASEFLDVAWPRTVLGRLDRLRRVPLYSNPAALVMGAATYAWLPPGASAPIGRLTAEAAALPSRRAAGIVVVSDGLLNFATPQAEAAIRDHLVNGLVAFADGALLSAAAIVTDTAPAGLRNAVTPIPSSGDPVEDVTAVLAEFGNLDGVALIMSEHNAIALALRAGGAIQNGRIAGIVPVLGSSAAGTNIVAVRQPDVLYGDDGRLDVRVSRQAALEMAAEPSHDSTTPTPSELVSLFQAGSAALLVQRYFNWSARAGAVAVISDAVYHTEGS